MTLKYDEVKTSGEHLEEMKMIHSVVVGGHHIVHYNKNKQSIWDKKGEKERGGRRGREKRKERDAERTGFIWIDLDECKVDSGRINPISGSIPVESIRFWDFFDQCFSWYFDLSDEIILFKKFG